MVTFSLFSAIQNSSHKRIEMLIELNALKALSRLFEGFLNFGLDNLTIYENRTSKQLNFLDKKDCKILFFWTPLLTLGASVLFAIAD